MKQGAIIAGIVVALLAIIMGVAFASNSFTEPDSTAMQATTPSPTATAVASTEEVTAAEGKYIVYESGIIEKTAGTKVLFFHAPWCPQCRALEKSIQEGTIPSGLTIIKVDYDTNQELRQKYGVTIQTSLVRVSDTGELLERYVAYEEPTLKALLDNAL